MPEWKIDGTNDIVGIVVIAALVIGALTLVAILLIRRGGGLRVGKDGLEINGKKGKATVKDSEVPAQEHRRVMDTHSEQLNRIEDNQNKIFSELERLFQININQSKDIKATGMALHLMKPAIKTLIDVADGKPKNGNIEEAYEALDAASKVFDENLINKLGGA